MRATTNLLRLLHVVPALGRAFEQKDATAATSAAMLSDRAWRNRFGTDPSAVGREIIAVVMAISGVYSLVAFTVARRRRETAVRVALGGTRSAIVRALLRQSLRPAGIGIALGLIFSGLVSRAAAPVLFGVNPLDPLTYILTPTVRCLAAAAASCIPALKATRADSVVVLRAE